MAANPYSTPTRLCDLVMKGGITSGVVYPLTVCELASAYSFKNIGGTSAGAIAAAAAAAAEYDRRQHGANAKGFDRLKALPVEIGAPGRLMKMFEPDAATRELFAILTAGLNARSTAGKLLAVSLAAVRRFWIRAIAAVIVIGVMVQWARGHELGWIGHAILALAALAVIGVFIASVIVTLFYGVTRTLPKNDYGLSHAYDPKGKPGEPPLTNWLTTYLDELAGKQPGDGPLTFGDLHRAMPAPVEPPPDPDSRSINLEMMTTAVNFGRPFRLPFRNPDQLFYFARTELARFFPAHIVQHMVEHARESKDPPRKLPSGEVLYGFPSEEHLPVIVATRMSLSFPILLAAVPLYAIDYTRTKEADRKPERVWFSDGGICSNLPIHFFDSALPQWPTFAINLKGVHPDHHETEADMVWLPTSAGSGSTVAWTRFDEGRAPLSGFLVSIIETMQNWQDNTQSRVPGYRERLAHVSQRTDEGGLNLNMPEAKIQLLAERGRVAGERLRARYHDNGGAGWNDHRWVRLRTTMEVTFEWLHKIVSSYPSSIPPDVLIEQILMRDNTAPPGSYRMGSQEQQRAQQAMANLVALAAAQDPAGSGFLGQNRPHPLPELRIKPRV